ncbi:MAG: hypothetical protein B6I32_07065 [Desulfobacterium sp. 4572_20]|nr:MAG: hypothetical protein B6I32_07065 [Desulfobacterium sp. 4572_20]
MGSSSVNNKLYTTICLSIAQLGYQFLEKYFDKCNNSPDAEIAEHLFLFCFPLSPANTNGIKGRKAKTCIPVLSFH